MVWNLICQPERSHQDHLEDDHSKPEPKKRLVPEMPEGYYSSDKPNPHLLEFVEKNMTPYDPEHDDYQVEPFNEAITTTRAKAIYNMHTYRSKKPHDAIRPDQDQKHIKDK